MEQIKLENEKSIFSWCPDIEEDALNMMKEIVSQPYVKHGALMPDTHHGEAAPIGSVLACDDVIIPWAVGSDIGCGMISCMTSLKKQELNEENKKQLLESFQKTIPVGFCRNNETKIKKLKDKYKNKIDFIIYSLYDVKYNPVRHIEDEFYSQLGTLGSGNHFCEIQHDEEDKIRKLYKRI